MALIGPRPLITGDVLLCPRTRLHIIEAMRMVPYIASTASRTASSFSCSRHTYEVGQKTSCRLLKKKLPTSIDGGV